MFLRRLYAGRGLMISLCLAFVAVESIVAACFLSLVHLKTAHNWVEKSHNLSLEIERAMNAVAGAETNQRGYLITGSDHYLASYRDALDTIGIQIQHLGSMTGNNANQRDRIVYLTAQVRQRLDELDSAIVTRRNESPPFAKSAVGVNQYHVTSEALHEIAWQIREEETRALERHRADSEAWAVTTGSFAVALSLVTAVVFALCGVIIKMAMMSQAHAERILQNLPRISTPSEPK